MYVYLCTYVCRLLLIVTFIIFNYLHFQCIISTVWMLNLNNKLTYLLNIQAGHEGKQFVLQFAVITLYQVRCRLIFYFGIRTHVIMLLPYLGVRQKRSSMEDY